MIFTEETKQKLEELNALLEEDTSAEETEQKRKKVRKASKTLTDSLKPISIVKKNRDVFCRPVEKQLEKYFLTRKQKLFFSRL